MTKRLSPNKTNNAIRQSSILIVFYVSFLHLSPGFIFGLGYFMLVITGIGLLEDMIPVICKLSIIYVTGPLFAAFAHVSSPLSTIRFETSFLGLIQAAATNFATLACSFAD